MSSIDFINGVIINTPLSVNYKSQQRVQNKNYYNRRDDRFSSRLANAFRAVGTIQAVIATEHRDNVAEENRFNHTARQVVEVRKHFYRVHKNIRADSRILRSDEPAASNADNVSKNCKNRYNYHTSYHARDD